MSLHYQWQLPRTNVRQSQLIKILTRKLKIPQYLITLLVQRHVDSIPTIQNFLHPKLTNLKNPFKIHDMSKGIRQIKAAIKRGERITIYGDYDVDGITSTSIMYLLLKHFRADVHYFIPNRFRDGYGPNLHEYKKIIQRGTKLLITVDNGISGLKEISYAQKHGMNVIITDHHDFPKHLPPANAIIMAAYPHHQYHFTDFCGAGIAFKIAQAMLHKIPKKFLDLATLGTIADSVSLTDENRVIVTYGLPYLQNSQRPGIQALAKAARIQLLKLNSTELSFTLIPRLNALGRMEDANAGVQLLTTNHDIKALDIAQMTEQMNRKRQAIMNEETKSALAQANTPQNRKKTTLVLANHNWFPGVVGIIASRVVNQYYKPTIVIGHLKYDDQRGIDRGSGRSVPEFNLFQAMTPLKKILTSFGGHPMACGLSVKPERIKALRRGLEKAGQKAHLQHVVPKIKIGLKLKTNQITPSLLANLKKLAPFGQNNPFPLIDLQLPVLYNLRTMGKGGRHLSFTLGPSFRSIHLVAWQMGGYYPYLKRNPQQIEIAGVLNVNHYRGRNYLQIVVKHLRHYHPVMMPDKKEMGIIYKYLYSKHILQYQDYFHDLVIPISQYLNLNPAKIATAIQIFSEIQLMTKTIHRLTVDLNPHQHQLNESQTYLKYRNQIE